MQVWVESVVMVGYGRYRITARDYSALHFSDSYTTQADIDALAGGLAPGTNDNGDPLFFGEVDPDPPGYACDAYKTAVAALGGYSWELDDAASPTPVEAKALSWSVALAASPNSRLGRATTPPSECLRVKSGSFTSNAWLQLARLVTRITPTHHWVKLV